LSSRSPADLECRRWSDSVHSRTPIKERERSGDENRGTIFLSGLLFLSTARSNPAIPKPRQSESDGRSSIARRLRQRRDRARPPVAQFTRVSEVAVGQHRVGFVGENIVDQVVCKVGRDGESLVGSCALVPRPPCNSPLFQRTFLACQPVGNHMTRARSASATLRRHSYTEDYQGYFHQHGQQKCRDQRPQHALAGNHHLWTFTSHDGCLPYANGQFTRQCAVSATKQLNIYLCLSVQVISPFFQAGIGRRDNSRLSPCQTRRPEVGHPYPPELTAKRKLILNSIRNY